MTRKLDFKNHATSILPSAFKLTWMPESPRGRAVWACAAAPRARSAWRAESLLPLAPRQPFRSAAGSTRYSPPETTFVWFEVPMVKKGVSRACIPVLRIRIRWIRMFLGLLDPDTDPLVRGMDQAPDPDPFILLSSSKNRKKNLESYCFVTIFLLFIFEKLCKYNFKK